MSSGSHESLVAKLQAKSTGPRQWEARCPFHDDSNPSLSISISESGKLLTHCHAGCEGVFERLVDAGYIETAERSLEKSSEVVYSYLDADGVLAFEIVRFPGKKFRGRRLDQDGVRHWNVPEDIRVPYRLPEILKSDRQTPVFIVEGEKDADTLATHGYVASSCPFGAKSWRTTFNQHFAGRRVIIVPDNDEVGAMHAEQVRSHLEPIAAQVQILSLRGEVPEKGDVSDLIATKGPAAFKRLIDALPVDAESSRPYLTIADLARLPPRKWLVDGLLSKHGLALLYGDAGVGKTFVTLDMSVRIACGESAFGQRTSAGLVYYVALEGQSGLHTRIEAACSEIGVLDTSWVPLAVHRQPLDLSAPESVGELVRGIEEAAKRFGVSPALVVVDTLSRAMPGKNENTPEDMGTAVSALTRIQRDTGATVLAIHHVGKTSERGARGHSSLRAAVDTELYIARDAKGRVLKVTKQRDGSDDIQIPFELVTKVIASGELGESTESKIVRVLNRNETEQQPQLNGQARTALRTLKEALRSHGATLAVEEATVLGIPAGLRVIRKEVWVAALDESVGSKGKESSRQRARNRAVDALRQSGLLGEKDDHVWLAQDHRPDGRMVGTDAGTGQDCPSPSAKKKGKPRASSDRTGQPPLGVSGRPTRGSPLIHQRQWQ